MVPSEALNVIFMGTSEFAVPCFQKLLQTPDLNVSAVVTVPDKPAGRSLEICESPIKIAAHGTGIPILQPVDLRDPFFLRSIQGFEPDIAAIVAFRILPTELFSIPTLGCVNLHASLLPDLRGAAPIQWAIMRGYDRTGVSTFLIERKVDTGRLLAQTSVAIDPDDDAGSLSSKLSIEGANLLVESLLRVGRGEAHPQTQFGEPTLAPKITKEICRIDWNQPAIEIHNLIRGLSPIPSAHTFIGGKMLKIFSSFTIAQPQLAPGNVQVTGEGILMVGTGVGSLGLVEIQIEGKRRMNSSEFLRGRAIVSGTVLS